MFVMLVAIAALMFIAFLPAIIDPEERHVWYERFFYCRGWSLDEDEEERQQREARESRARARNNGEGARYILSPLQEEEIRDSFIKDRLKAFSMTLDASHIGSATPKNVKKNPDVRPLSTKNNGSSDESIPNVPDLEMGATPAYYPSHAIEESATTESSTSGTDSGPEDVYYEEDGTTWFSDIVTAAASLVRLPSSSSSSSSSASSASGETPTKTDEQDIPESIRSAIVTSIDEEDYGTVWVPPAGEPLMLTKEENSDTRKSTTLRPFSNSCSICLAAFEKDDVVSWSHCPECPHVFHSACIADWLNMMGRKHMQKRYERRRQHGNYILRQDPITTITNMPMLCPCCRQPFIRDVADTASEAAKGESPRRDAVAETTSVSSVSPSASEAVQVTEEEGDHTNSTATSTARTTDSACWEARQRIAEVMVSTV
mmetsp:Transcript_14195/g.27176  ORF Transcript_14195/g.27176 Transcript_14195/m.27176 type:complete len:430 (-) Transcript_14195:28-1317(-)